MKLGFALFASVVGLTIHVSEAYIPPPGANNFYDPPYDPSREPVVEGFEQCFRLVPSDAAANDRFGFDTAYDGTSIAVSAPYDNDCTGAVYIFQDNGSGMEETVKLVAPDNAPFHLFGEKIDLNRGVLVVGSSRLDGGRGAIYVWVRDNSLNWNFAGKLTAPQAAEGDRLGWSVATSNVGTTYFVAAGMVGEDVNKLSNVGSVHIWKVQKSSASASYLTALSSPSGTRRDLFGSSLSMYEGYLVAGAYGTNDETGMVHLFQYDSNADEWNFLYSASHPDAVPGTRFGFDVSITNNDFLAVGADGHQKRIGAVFMFKLNSTAATPFQTLQPADCLEGDGCGTRVHLHGNKLLTSAYFNDVDEYWGGAAFYYELTNTPSVQWELKRRLKAYETQPRDYFGHSISLHDDFSVVGATGDDFSANHAGSVWLCSNEGGPTIITPSCPDLVPKLDILFIVDVSGSIYNSDFRKLKKFIAGLSYNFTVSPTDTRFALSTYSTGLQYKVDFGSIESTNPVAWRSYVSSLTRQAGYTNTPAALIDGWKNVFTADNFRADAKRVVVVATDGLPNRGWYECLLNGLSWPDAITCSQESAQRLKMQDSGAADDVEFVYLPVGVYADKNLFNGIADKLVEASFSSLSDVTNTLVTEISC